MRKYLLCSLILLLSSAPSFSQTWKWVNEGSATNTTTGKSIATDKNGNIFSAGIFKDTIFSGAHMLTSNGGLDIFVAKYDSAGNLIWSRSCGGTLNDGYSLGCAVDLNGNVYISTSFDGNGTFDTIHLTAVYQDIIIMKYDSSGNLVYAKPYGGPSNDISTSCEVNDAGELFITGFFNDDIDFGNTHLVSNGLTEIYIAKFDANGDPIWAKRAGGNSYDNASGIAIRDNKLFITGYYNSTADFDTINISSSGGDDIFFACYDTSGNIKWLNGAHGSGSFDIGNKIDFDGMGNLFACGQFEQTITFGTQQLSSNGLTDIFICKLDSNGSFDWVTSYGSDSLDAAYDLDVTNDGYHFVTGYFSDSITFGGNTYISAGDKDIFVLLNSNSNSLQWVKTTGGGYGDDIGSGIAANGNSQECFVTGFYYSSASFDAFNVSATGQDVFTGKLSLMTPVEEINYDLINIYPNPLQGGDVIQLAGDLSKFKEIKLYNNTGELVLISHERNTITLPDLSAGIYYMMLFAEKGIISKKILIQ